MDSLSTPNTAALLGSALAVCFLVANAKSLPFAHSFRLLPSFYRLLLQPRLFPVARKTGGVLPSKPSSGSAAAAAAARPALFKHHVTSSRAVLLDLDINMHKSNSTFFADADINRAELLTRLLGRGLAATGPPSAAIPLLAAVQCSFKREISPFQAYRLSSRILAWDDRSLFTVTYFLKPGAKLPADVEVAGGPGAVLGDPSLKRSVYAVMVTRYVCKAGRETVAPAAVLEAAGLLVAGPGVQGAEKEKHDAGLLAADDVGMAVKRGMQYVGDCMV
ncbi:hypothetical protein VTK56DRAFT_1182 [Thermocarpiscus australiensis]